MIYNVYSVHDVKTHFNAPFIEMTDEAAQRGFLYSFSQQSSLITFSPADFRLYRVGKFDSGKGVLEPCTPVFICDALSANDTGGVS